jgi:hypothetical protein
VRDEFEGCLFRGPDCSSGEGARIDLLPGEGHRREVAMGFDQLRIGMTLGIVSCFLLVRAFGAEPALEIEVSGDWLNFRLEGTSTKDTWVLQHATEGVIWEDLIFLEPLVSIDFKSRFGKSFDRAILDDGEKGKALFRVEKRVGGDDFYEEILASRAIWRSAEIASYTYELSYQRGMSSWRGRCTVVNGVVTMTETISSFPEQFGPPAELTIDAWFEKILALRANGADEIRVAWDKDLGYPANGFVDLFFELVDEEEYWTMSELSPME